MQQHWGHRAGRDERESAAEREFARTAMAEGEGPRGAPPPDTDAGDDAPASTEPKTGADGSSTPSKTGGGKKPSSRKRPFLPDHTSCEVQSIGAAFMATLSKCGLPNTAAAVFEHTQYLTKILSVAEEEIWTPELNERIIGTEKKVLAEVYGLRGQGQGSPDTNWRNSESGNLQALFEAKKKLIDTLFLAEWARELARLLRNPVVGDVVVLGTRVCRRAEEAMAAACWPEGRLGVVQKIVQEKVGGGASVFSYVVAVREEDGVGEHRPQMGDSSPSGAGDESSPAPDGEEYDVGSRREQHLLFGRRTWRGVAVPHARLANMSRSERIVLKRAQGQFLQRIILRGGTGRTWSTSARGTLSVVREKIGNGTTARTAPREILQQYDLRSDQLLTKMPGPSPTAPERGTILKTDDVDEMNRCAAVGLDVNAWLSPRRGPFAEGRAGQVGGESNCSRSRKEDGRTMLLEEVDPISFARVEQLEKDLLKTTSSSRESPSAEHPGTPAGSSRSKNPSEKPGSSASSESNHQRTPPENASSPNEDHGVHNTQHTATDTTSLADEFFQSLHPADFRLEKQSTTLLSLRPTDLVVDTLPKQGCSLPLVEQAAKLAVTATKKRLADILQALYHVERTLSKNAEDLPESAGKKNPSHIFVPGVLKRWVRETGGDLVDGELAGLMADHISAMAMQDRWPGGPDPDGDEGRAGSSSSQAGRTGTTKSSKQQSGEHRKSEKKPRERTVGEQAVPSAFPTLPELRGLAEDLEFQVWGGGLTTSALMAHAGSLAEMEATHDVVGVDARPPEPVFLEESNPEDLSWSE